MCYFLMKTKLTLTVKKHIVDSAKQAARERDQSLSQLFEEIFENDQLKLTKTELQKSAYNLLS